MSNLTLGFLAGTAASSIYRKYGDEFGWDASLSGQFGPQKRLFAENATKEGYSVWMIVHDDLCEAYNEEHSWYDYVEEDTIEEVWIGAKTEFFHDCSTRVTFVKTPDGYAFWGLFAPAGVEERTFPGGKRPVKIYRRIGKNYPVDVQPEPKKPIELATIEDGCKVQAFLLEQNIKTTLTIDIKGTPNHKNWLGKKVGDILKAPNPRYSLSYRVEKILAE